LFGIAVRQYQSQLSLALPLRERSGRKNKQTTCQCSSLNCAQNIQRSLPRAAWRLQTLAAHDSNLAAAPRPHGAAANYLWLRENGRCRVVIRNRDEEKSIVDAP
jgi:hypothetical protein